ncbi:hypothetical protein BK412_10305 [Vibrio campbellii]|uniref:TcfC E-set like domain-containing protein n=1 Tax=Vibrio campbellii TaxID=680 RepID=UPI0009BDC217|nr:TcfC E-set like domain-containing protein [Vibrio campbellii]OQQ04013.1 hypothetical protein BK412_10305 [Vibrio campbellii]
MNRAKSLLSVLACLIMSPSYAIMGPSDFSDFFETKEKQVEVTLSSELGSGTVMAIVSYEKFILINSTSNINALSDYLKNSNLKQWAVDEIIEQLLDGVAAFENCEGEISDCIPEDIPNKAEFVFDYYSNKLRIYVSSSMVDDRAQNVEFYSGSRVDNAIINDSSLYLQYSDDSGAFTWSNITVAGLPYGYLKADTQYSSSTNQFDVYEAAYNVDFADKRLIVGHKDFSSSIDFNSTDLLFSEMNLTGQFVQFGSSTNLLKNKSEGIQRVNFFAPQSGQLELFQGERLVLTKGVQEGEQSVPYSELPGGAYNLRIVLRRGERLLLNEERFIVNVASYKLATGNYDYKLGVHWLPSLDNNDELSQSEQLFGYGAVTYRFDESTLLSLAAGSNGNDIYGQFGLAKVFDGQKRVDYVSSYFANGDMYQQISVGVEGMGLAAKYISNEQESNALSTRLYGQDDRLEYSANWSRSLLGGSGTLGYTHSEYQESDSKSDSLSYSWSRNAFGGQLSLSGTYSKYGDSDSFNTLLSWSTQLEGNYQSTLSSAFDQNGLISVRNQLSRNFESENWSGNGALAAIVDQAGAKGDMSILGSGHTDEFNFSGYGYGSTEGDYSLSGTISGSQIMSGNTQMLTRKRSETYVFIAPAWGTDDNSGEVSYSVVKNSRIWLNDHVSAEKPALIELPNYSEVEIRLDAEYESLEVQNDFEKTMAMPGSLYVIENKVTKLKTQTLVMSDMFGEPISNASCIGKGCRSIDPVSEDGVFRVSYLEEQPFKIVSSQRLCVSDQAALGQDYVQSYCLPGLDESVQEALAGPKLSQSQQQAVESDVKAGFVYVGKFHSAPEVDKILMRLKEVNLVSHNIKVGEVLYVYFRNDVEYSLAQRQILESLEAYAIEDKHKQDNHTV